MRKVVALVVLAASTMGAYGCSADGDDHAASSQDELNGAKRVHCASIDDRYNTCDAEGKIRSVELVRQVSRSQCTEGTSWGYTPGEEHVWVKYGCRADFEIRYEPVKVRVDCSSVNYGYSRCDAPVTGIESIRLVRQISGRACTEGTSFGFDDDTIWVDHGCRGTFEVAGYPKSNANTVKEELDCSSTGGQTRCTTTLENIQAVRLVRQLSRSSCRENYSFGYDAQGVWVDRGCRGRFEVEGTAPANE